MNIIIDEDTKSKLMAHSLDFIEFGSKMRGSDTNESDTDVLVIVRDSIKWLLAPVYTHHLLQYKDLENNRDMVFCTPSTFIKSIIDGDSTIFYDIMMHQDLSNTCLNFLKFYNFNTSKKFKTYLGLARRDLRDSSKHWFTNNARARKKINFAIDHYNYVNGIINKNSNDYVFTESLDAVDVIESMDHLLQLISELKITIQTKADNGTIPQRLNKKTIIELNDFVYDIGTVNYNAGLNYFYEAHCNGN